MNYWWISDTHVHLNAQSKQGGQQQDGGRRASFRNSPRGQSGVRRGDGQSGPRGSQIQSKTVVGYDTAADQLLAEMDKYSIEKALIMPPPQIQEQGAVCNYKDFIDVARKHPGRLYFLGGGDILKSSNPPV